MASPSSAKIEPDEISTIYSHYDYWTGRAIRIIIDYCNKDLIQASDLSLALSCLDIAIKHKSTLVSRKAKEFALQDYRTLSAARIELRVTDVQLKVLELLATVRPDRTARALRDLLEVELSKLKQTELAL